MHGNLTSILADWMKWKEINLGCPCSPSSEFFGTLCTTAFVRDTATPAEGRTLRFYTPTAPHLDRENASSIWERVTRKVTCHGATSCNIPTVLIYNSTTAVLWSL